MTKPNSKPEAKPDPKPDPQPLLQPEPQPEPQPASLPASQPAPSPVPTPPVGLDWPALIRAGLSPLQLGGLALRPPEFWALTPAELAMMLGQTAVPSMGRARFEALAAMYPDDPSPSTGPRP